MNTKQLLNEWQRFLVESSSSDVNVELNGTELTVYHLTSKNNLNVPTRNYSSIEKPKPTGDKAKDIINNIQDVFKTYHGYQYGISWRDLDLRGQL